MTFNFPTRLLIVILFSLAGSVFAEPKLLSNTEDIEWYSELNGQPERLLSLSKEQQLHSKKLLTDRLSAISKLADQLPKLEPRSEDFQSILKKAIQFPGDRAIYVVDGQPVITFWGIPDPTKKSVIPPVLLDDLEDESIENKPKKRSPHFLSFLLWLLAFLLLVGSLWYWLSMKPINWQNYNPFIDKYPMLLSEVNAAKDNCLVLKHIYNHSMFINKDEERFILIKQQIKSKITLCNAYKKLNNEIESAQLDCGRLKKLSVESQYLQHPKGKFIALQQQLIEYQKYCKRKKIEHITNLCPEERARELAPEIIVVLDASLSMAFPSTIEKTKQFDKYVEPATAQFNRLKKEHGEPYAYKKYTKHVLRLSPENNSRMRGAKIAINNLVQTVPSDMNIGLVILKKCPAANKHGFYSPENRDQFLDVINNVNPEAGTPLGNALYKAGQMVDGTSKAATIIVISDGMESCKADPCAVAKNLAAKKPYLTINVVDILGTGSGNCIAKATKEGKVFTAHNIQDIITMTQKAASSALPKTEAAIVKTCKK